MKALHEALWPFFGRWTSKTQLHFLRPRWTMKQPCRTFGCCHETATMARNSHHYLRNQKHTNDNNRCGQIMKIWRSGYCDENTKVCTTQLDNFSDFVGSQFHVLRDVAGSKILIEKHLFLDRKTAPAFIFPRLLKPNKWQKSLLWRLWHVYVCCHNVLRSVCARKEGGESALSPWGWVGMGWVGPGWGWDVKDVKEC